METNGYSYRISTTTPTASCWRLGGYAFAVN